MKTIGLLSGKGGSGKTTLGLTMASLLAKSGNRTLLVDCDLSTNGATYFFEDQVSLTKESTFWDVLQGEEPVKNEYLKIENNFFFTPSANIGMLSNRPYDYQLFDKDKARSRFILYLGKAREEMDVVIFDCQAGSSSVLYTILPYIDIALMVLEPDKVSSLALRNLYTKMATTLQDKKVFQVFNKVNDNEKEFYEKVTFGTFFTNVGALLYDWSIRKAFAFSIIPNIEEDAISYGFQIADLCKRIIVERKIREKILLYEKNLLYIKKKRDLAVLKNQLSEITTEYDNNWKTPSLKKYLKYLYRIIIFELVGGAIFCIIRSLFKYFSNTNIINDEMLIPIISITIIVLSILSTIGRRWIGDDDENYEKEEIKELSTNIDLLEKEIDNLSKSLEKGKS